MSTARKHAKLDVSDVIACVKERWHRNLRKSQRRHIVHRAITSSRNPDETSAFFINFKIHDDSLPVFKERDWLFVAQIIYNLTEEMTDGTVGQDDRFDPWGGVLWAPSEWSFQGAPYTVPTDYCPAFVLGHRTHRWIWKICCLDSRIHIIRHRFDTSFPSHSWGMC